MIEQRRNIAKALSEEGRYAEAADAYRQLWSETHDVWDGYRLAQNLRKSGCPQEALETCETLLESSPNLQAARNLAAWAIWDTEIKPATSCSERLLRAVGRIADLSDTAEEGGRYSAYSPFPAAALHALKLLSQNDNWNRLLEIAHHIDPGRLSATAERSADGKAKPSPRERWHGYTTKALDRTAQWETLLIACDQALADSDAFTRGSKTWISWRKAKALRHLDRAHEAREVLKPLCAERSVNPAVDAEMARVFASMGDTDGARTFFARCFLSATDIGLAVTALAEVADLLDSLAEPHLADHHRLLSETVRRERGWLRSDGYSPNLTGLSSDVLRDQLAPTWREWADQGLHWVAGTVTKILPNGAAGFVHGDDRGDYYFLLRDVDESAPVTPGDRVELVPGFRFDKKRNQERPAAQRLRLLAEDTNPTSAGLNG